MYFIKQKIRYYISIFHSSIKIKDKGVEKLSENVAKLLNLTSLNLNFTLKYSFIELFIIYIFFNYYITLKQNNKKRK